MAPQFHIIGLVEGQFFILMDQEGHTCYVPFSWMWEGNG